MKLPAAIYDRVQSRNAFLFSQHLEGPIAEDLVMLNQDANRAGRVVRQCFAALPSDLLRLALACRGEEALPAAEAANHGLHSDSGAPRDLIERDLIRRQLPEDLDSCVEDALGGRCGGLGPGDHAIGAAEGSFDISYLKLQSADYPES